MPKHCPNCSATMQRNGIRSGFQCWRCPNCPTAITESDRKPGRPIGSTPSASVTDRVRKHRKNLKNKENDGG